METKYSPPATSTLVSEKQVEVKEGLVPVSEDPVAIKIAELLENVTLIHKPVSLQPRGLINKGNWGYINATLQALVACPLMYHLMKFIPLYSKVAEITGVEDRKKRIQIERELIEKGIALIKGGR